MSGALHVRNLGKAYRRWGSEFSRMLSWFGIPARPVDEHWVLRDISFTVGGGEAVGIIGQNGAGKSTLLKLITGTLRPSEGEVVKIGRIAAILELGMGFNPEMTGRQNAWHAAGLMGYSHEEILQAMPAIEEFAEVGEYFDQPIRSYSSGMQVRVAFSVATAFVPDVLIVDEALSVGDSYFQHKSFDRLRKLREMGVSILLVTHSMSDVKSLCDRAMLLENGVMVKDGQPDEVVDYYNAIISEKENARLTIEQRRSKEGWLLTKSGTGEARIRSLGLYSEEGEEVRLARVGQKLELRLVAEISTDIENLVLGFMIRDKQGHVVWGTNTWHTHQVLNRLEQGEVVNFTFPFSCTIGPGSYSVSPALVSTDTHLVNNYEWIDNLIVFDVANMDHPVFIGTSWIDSTFSISRVGQDQE